MGIQKSYSHTDPCSSMLLQHQYLDQNDWWWTSRSLFTFITTGWQEVLHLSIWSSAGVAERCSTVCAAADLVPTWWCLSAFLHHCPSISGDFPHFQDDKLAVVDPFPRHHIHQVCLFLTFSAWLHKNCCVWYPVVSCINLVAQIIIAIGVIADSSGDTSCKCLAITASSLQGLYFSYRQKLHTSALKCAVTHTFFWNINIL